MNAAPCSCGTGQPCPSHLSGFGGLFDDSGVSVFGTTLTIDKLASFALVALAGLTFWQFFMGKKR